MQFNVFTGVGLGYLAYQFQYGTKSNTKDSDKEEKEETLDSETGQKIGKLKNLTKGDVLSTMNQLKAEGRTEEVRQIKARILKTCGKLGKMEMNMVDMMVAIYPMIIGQTIAWLFKKFCLNKWFKI